MMKILFGFLFLQIGTVLSDNCLDFNGCAANQFTMDEECGFLGIGTCDDDCCIDITNCQDFGCSIISVREPIPLPCSGNDCNSENCCRQSCSTFICNSFRNDISNPPEFCQSSLCSADECCEETLVCGTGGNDFTCPSGTSPKLGRILCLGDCSSSRCCFTNFCANSGYTAFTCSELGRTHVGGICGDSCTADTCCGGPTGTGDIDGGF